MIDTNLNGAYYVTQAFLPAMRARKSGTIVHIVSDAGKQASPKAGPAYVMSKFGLAGLTQSINAEARARMMRAEDIAECVMLAINLPSRAVIEELIIRPG